MRTSSHPRSLLLRRFIPVKFQHGKVRVVLSLSIHSKSIVCGYCGSVSEGLLMPAGQNVPLFKFDILLGSSCLVED